jgi:hypothetical protein
VLLELNGFYLFLICVDGVNLLDEGTSSIKKSAILLDVGNEVGIEVNA